MLSTLRHIFTQCSAKALFQNEIRNQFFTFSSIKIHSQKNSKFLKFILGSSLAICGGYSIHQIIVYRDVHAAKNISVTIFEPGTPKDNLPWYSLTDVGKHKDASSRIWVTFKQGVYDITEFVEIHPGGEIILSAAGKSIEPFWRMYGVHMNENVFEILESYRIGNISEEDSRILKGDAEDPYAMEPLRHPLLKPASLKPFNAEPPPSLLVENFLTPVDIFYVRNHLPVPFIKEDSYRLHIEGVNINQAELTLDDIKELPVVTVTATVMCAGNRRTEMTAVKPVKGLSWGHAAIGNATWTGVKLVDVLKHVGVTEDMIKKTKFEHVHFVGLDKDINNTPYAASIPIDKALDPRGDVILAYDMNGEPIPRDHGAPIRVIVPGVVGARNVKWLGKIILAEEESQSHWQQNDYKGFSPSTDWDTVDFSKSPAIQELPVISAVCQPIDSENVKLKDNQLEVKGYAWSGGGKAIVRVDITADQGKTWHVADLVAQDKNAKLTRNWSWTLWTALIPVEPKDGKVEIWAKAVDASYNTQPEHFSNVWNLRGVLSNAYHRITVNVS